MFAIIRHWGMYIYRSFDCNIKIGPDFLNICQIIMLMLFFLKRTIQNSSQVHLPDLRIQCCYRHDGVTVSVLASSAEGRSFDPQPGQNKDIKLVFAASPLSTHQT